MSERQWRLTRAAADDLAALYCHGVSEFGEARADAYYADIVSVFDLLADYPLLGQLRQEIRPPVRTFRVGRHIVVYEVGLDNAPLILRVRHGRDDWQSY